MAEAAWVYAIATVASTAYSAYSSNEAAKTNARLADFNARVERQNAELQMQYRELEANINEAQLRTQAEIQEANARQLEHQAQVQEETTREAIRRRREDFMRLRARQRAGIAASGVLEAGSPVEVLAHTAGVMELNLQDMLVEGENRRRALLTEAGSTRNQAGQTIFSIQNVRNQAAAARLQGTNMLQQAEITRLAGHAKSQALKREAVGTIFSGVASGAMGVYGLYDDGAFAFAQPKPQTAG